MDILSHPNSNGQTILGVPTSTINEETPFDFEAEKKLPIFHHFIRTDPGWHIFLRKIQNITPAIITNSKVDLQPLLAALGCPHNLDKIKNAKGHFIRPFVLGKVTRKLSLLTASLRTAGRLKTGEKDKKKIASSSPFHGTNVVGSPGLRGIGSFPLSPSMSTSSPKNPKRIGMSSPRSAYNMGMSSPKSPSSIPQPVRTSAAASTDSIRHHLPSPTLTAPGSYPQEQIKALSRLQSPPQGFSTALLQPLHPPPLSGSSAPFPQRPLSLLPSPFAEFPSTPTRLQRTGIFQTPDHQKSQSRGEEGGVEEPYAQLHQLGSFDSHQSPTTLNNNDDNKNILTDDELLLPDISPRTPPVSTGIRIPGAYTNDQQNTEPLSRKDKDNERPTPSEKNATASPPPRMGSLGTVSSSQHQHRYPQRRQLLDQTYAEEEARICEEEMLRKAKRVRKAALRRMKEENDAAERSVQELKSSVRSVRRGDDGVSFRLSTHDPASSTLRMRSTSVRFSMPSTARRQSNDVSYPTLPAQEDRIRDGYGRRDIMDKDLEESEGDWDEVNAESGVDEQKNRGNNNPAGKTEGNDNRKIDEIVFHSRVATRPNDKKPKGKEERTGIEADKGKGQMGKSGRSYSEEDDEDSEEGLQQLLRTMALAHEKKRDRRI